MHTSLDQLPSSRLYWNTTVGQEFVRGTMTYNCQKTINRFCLHFNSNDDWKSPGEAGFDLLFKTAIYLKQYNSAKPHKLGFKNFVLDGVTDQESHKFHFF